MNTPSSTLLDLIDRFYRKAFTFVQAQEQFGPVAEDQPARIRLDPQGDAKVTAVTLEKLRGKPDGDPFLAGICIQFKEPQVVDFTLLAERFGPEVELPRLKPWEDIPYRFLIQGVDYSGYLLCLVTAASDKQPPRKVAGVILRRFPPEQA